MIIGILIFIIDKVIKRMVKKSKTELDDIVLDIVRTPVIVIIILFGVKDSLDVFNEPKYAGSKYSIPETFLDVIDTLYEVILILAITWLAYKIFKRVLIYYGKLLAQKTHSNIDDDLIPLLNKVGGLIIVAFGAMGLLNYFGVNVTIFLAGMGIAGIVIAFAAQDTLSNLFSGIFLMIDKPFREGEVIKLENGDYCRIVDIGLRTTKLYNTFDHDYVILPNNMLANQKIVNVERPDRAHKVKVTVGVAYGTNVQKVTNLLLGIAGSHPKVQTKIKDKEP